MFDKETIEQFKHQNDFGPHHEFDICETNWKNYFFSHDALWNIQDDVVFSIFDKYMCKVGCQICYLNGYWMEDKNFSKFVPVNITEQYEETLLDLFKYFDRPNAIDDVRLLHDHYPKLFEFYKRNASIMEHNITDNGFFNQHKILTEELQFKKIAYLSFSDIILDKNDGEIIDKIIPMLQRLNDRSPIHKINFIASKGYVTENKNIMRLFDWVTTHMDCDTYFHTDLLQDEDWVADVKTFYNYDLPSIYYQENDLDPPVICQILTETTQLRHNKFYSTLTGSTIEDADYFYEFNDKFEVDKFLAGVIKGKLSSYKLYRNSIQKRENNRFFQYFDWCVENVIVNDNYTFIPTTMMPVMSPMYQRLMKEDFVDTPLGLLKKGATTVIPIASVRT